MNAGGYIYQNFTLGANTTFDFGAWFSSRESTTGAGSVSIWSLGMTPTMLAATTTVAPVRAGGYPWLQAVGTASLAAGTYQFRANLSDFTNVDTAFVAVPEPTTALAGILLGAGILRRSRSVRVHA